MHTYGQGSGPRGSAPAPELTRVIVAASLGNAMEWFDFLAYGSAGGRGKHDIEAFIVADHRFAPLPGVGHYAADQVPARVSEPLLEPLAHHPV
jgi:hypothetical protein